MWGLVLFDQQCEFLEVMVKCSKLVSFKIRHSLPTVLYNLELYACTHTQTDVSLFLLHRSHLEQFQADTKGKNP